MIIIIFLMLIKMIIITGKIKGIDIHYHRLIRSLLLFNFRYNELLPILARLTELEKEQEEEEERREGKGDKGKDAGAGKRR